MLERDEVDAITKARADSDGPCRADRMKGEGGVIWTGRTNIKTGECPYGQANTAAAAASAAASARGDLEGANTAAAAAASAAEGGACSVGEGATTTAEAISAPAKGVCGERKGATTHT